ncbi:uncharacterized protein H6S33_003448 [Morchella sextelata]|jgi:hypothetical protein|uniref:uncharacterized protein n=1 Tax=Morchella sextelata TaxID=1174677 RepID=UPI001D059ED3|nr:uncharacterized protein H6S33_003448 [Morchella sextelata]KAH0606614.1 hypothetical protein H6S33_003448 [Morchella sextelata]
MSPIQAPVESNSAPQSLQTQDGSRQPAHSPSTMPPPKPIREGHPNPQSMTNHEASRAGCLPSSGSQSAPWTPAPTTSDVHNRQSRSNSECSMYSTSSSLASPRHQSGRFQYEEVMNRYFTVNPEESPLAYAARDAIAHGVVQIGENMFARKCEEEGWCVSNRNGSDSSRTLGRSEEEKN